MQQQQQQHVALEELLARKGARPDAARDADAAQLASAFASLVSMSTTSRVGSDGSADGGDERSSWRAAHTSLLQPLLTPSLPLPLQQSPQAQQQRKAQLSAAFLERLVAFVAKHHAVDQPGLLWKQVLDAVSGTPRTALLYRLCVALIGGNYATLGPVLRRELFRWATADDDPALLHDQIAVLVALTANGKDISPFEIELGDVLASWLTNRFDEQLHSEMRELLALLIRVLKASRHFLAADNKTLIIQRACVVANSLRLASQLPLVEACLSVLEALVEQSVLLPPYSLMPIVTCVCRTVNIDSLCNQSWRIARGLLLSDTFGVETMQAFCTLLTKHSSKSSSANMGSVLRGAVFFVGMSCWGKDRVESLLCTPATVLPALARATKCGHSVVAYEVLLSVRRLVRKLGAELCVEWDAVFEILADMAQYTTSPTGQVSSSFVRVLVDTLLAVQELADSNAFLDDAERILWLLEEHVHLLPPAQCLGVLRRRLTQRSLSASQSAEEALARSLRKHLVLEQRSEPRLAALAAVQEWLSHSSNSGVPAVPSSGTLGVLAVAMDDARVALALPVWGEVLLALLALPAGQERASLVLVAQCVARNVAHAAVCSRLETFCACVDVISAAMSSARVAPVRRSRAPSDAQLQASSSPRPGGADAVPRIAAALGALAPRNAMLGQALDDAVCDGLASAFVVELNAGRGRRARYALHTLVALIAHAAPAVRHRVVHLMESLRTTADHHVTVGGVQTKVCVGSREMASGASATSNADVVDFSSAVEMLALQLQSESSKPLHGAIVATLYEWLWNGHILRGVRMDKVVKIVCARLLTGRVPEPFRGAAPGASDAVDALEHLKMVYQVATLLIGYGVQFSDAEARASDLLSTFLHGMTVSIALLDAAAHSSIKRICMNAICLVATHCESVVAVRAAEIMDALLAQRRNAVLAPHLPRVFNYLSRFPRFMAQLVLPLHHFAVLDYLVGLDEVLTPGGTPLASMASLSMFLNNNAAKASGGDKSGSAVAPKPQEQQQQPAPVASEGDRAKVAASAAISMMLQTAVQWLLSVAIADRPSCYRHMLGPLLKLLGGPHTVIVEAHIDLLANYAFLACVPGQGPVAPASERFNFHQRDAALFLQGNLIMEMVSGNGGWVLVTVRRPSGSVQWVARMQNDLLPLFSASSGLQTQHVPPPIRTYATLTRPIRVLTPLAPSPLPRVGSVGPVVATAPPKFMSMIDEAVVVSCAVPHLHSDLCTSTARRRSSADAAFDYDAPTPGRADVPPLNPTNHLLELDLAADAENRNWATNSSGSNAPALLSPKPPTSSSSAQQQPPPPQQQVYVQTQKTTHASQSDSDDQGNLRMGALFSYEDDAEEDRDVFFAAHSLDGARADTVPASWTSSTSVSPTLGAKMLHAAANAAPLTSSTTTPPPPIPPRDSTASPLLHVLQRHSDEGVSAPALATAPLYEPVPVPRQRAVTSWAAPTLQLQQQQLQQQQQPLPHSHPFSPATPTKSPGVATAPSPSSALAEMAGGDGNAAVAPHSSLLLLQLRFIPFCDEPPVRIIKTGAVQRAINVLDYMYPFVTRKMGVLFVGRGQHTEEEVLGNARGSVEYARFLRRLGEMVRLKAFAGFAGGLDTHADTDGPFALRYRDELEQVMFHVATLMPTRDGDVLNKKRHIGNDNVHIVWNESEGEYDPAALRGEFNFVQLLITPMGSDRMRVSVYRKKEMGHFSPMSLSQVVHVDALAPIVLHTAINADREVCALLGVGGDQFVGAATRLRQLKKLRTLITSPPQ